MAITKSWKIHERPDENHWKPNHVNYRFHYGNRPRWARWYDVPLPWQCVLWRFRMSKKNQKEVFQRIKDDHIEIIHHISSSSMKQHHSSTHFFFLRSRSFWDWNPLPIRSMPKRWEKMGKGCDAAASRRTLRITYSQGLRIGQKASNRCK